MTISVYDYFKTRKSDRKKEVRYIAVINKDSCTSCNSCATQCPVDCIYEVPSPIPSQSYHQIDTSRCIGCQLCYRVPSESTAHYNLEICPWNAIDMLHNPNMAKGEGSVLEPYWQGEDRNLPWMKMEEYAYQFRLDGEVFLPHDLADVQQMFQHFEQPLWYYDESVRVPLIYEAERTPDYIRYRATDEGRAVLDVMFDEYGRIFLD